MAKKHDNEPLENIEHPSQDHTDRFEQDQFIRGFGFTIYSRKKEETPVWLWKRNNKTYTQRGVLRIIQKIQKGEYKD